MFEMRPSIVTPLTNVMVQAGGTATFTCRVCGRPRPNVTWTFNNNISVVTDYRTDIAYIEDGTVTLQVYNYNVVLKYRLKLH